ncbi:hypothetical protein JJB07_00480 [Tumebacillus sp. ITR2]|uniref:Uncharacterized protein n=1 Tax=Tumebacillus amylolyticus TaxID=2801339 RepID=A0ABS1J4B8_9BACL|nr:hypothetical protein [Tumebacillus amylolyticus]MBL0385106.1 hypothetical protein [Tumebacillus amylolyticus]
MSISSHEVKTQVTEFLDQLDEHLYDVPDSCTGVKGEPFIKRDAQFPKSLFEEMQSWVSELSDIDVEDEEVESLPQISPEYIDKLSDLLSYDGSIYDLADFDVSNRISNLVSEDRDAYDEGLNGSIETATSDAYEELEDLVDSARDDIKELVATLKKILSDLS